MIHDPMCPYRPAQSDVCDRPFSDRNISCAVMHVAKPEIPCQCQLIAKVRADERSRKGTCWREAEGSQIPSGAVRVYREAGWFWEMPTVNTIKTVDGVTEDEITEFLEQL